MTWFLKLCGVERIYICHWGVFPTRYTNREWVQVVTLDCPYQKAPPWTRSCFRRITPAQ